MTVGWRLIANWVDDDWQLMVRHGDRVGGIARDIAVAGHDDATGLAGVTTVSTATARCSAPRQSVPTGIGGPFSAICAPV